MDGPFQSLYMGMLLCSLLKLKFGIYDISYTKFYTKSNILYKFYPLRSFHYSWNYNLILFLYKRNIWFILGILILFYYWATFKWNSVQQILTSCFSPVFSTRMNMRWLSFSFQHNINIETTLSHQHWINLTLSTMFCQHWNNVNKHTLAQLSFSTKFQRWFNVDVFAGMWWSIPYDGN